MHNQKTDDLIKRAAGDLVASSHAIVLTGAGISTESGVADFRGPKGIWTTNKQAEAQAYQRYERFLNDPRAYWEEMLGTVGTGSDFYKQMREVGTKPGPPRRSPPGANGHRQVDHNPERRWSP